MSCNMESANTIRPTQTVCIHDGFKSASIHNLTILSFGKTWKWRMAVSESHKCKALNLWLNKSYTSTLLIRSCCCWNSKFSALQLKKNPSISLRLQPQCQLWPVASEEARLHTYAIKKFPPQFAVPERSVGSALDFRPAGPKKRPRRLHTTTSRIRQLRTTPTIHLHIQEHRQKRKINIHKAISQGVHSGCIWECTVAYIYVKCINVQARLIQWNFFY